MISLKSKSHYNSIKQFGQIPNPFPNANKIFKFIDFNNPVLLQEFEKLKKNHLAFLQNGGAGGTWKIIKIKGIVTALYFGIDEGSNNQAILERRFFPEKINLEHSILPFSSFCGSFFEKISLKNSDFSYSIFTDTQAVSSNFSDCNLAFTDFSRSNLAHANFEYANLTGADFENCNLTGTNFKHAVLTGAKFQGAVLNNTIK